MKLSFYIKANPAHSEPSCVSLLAGELYLWLMGRELQLLSDDYMALVVSAFYLPRDVNEFRVCNDCAPILPVLKSLK